MDISKKYVKLEQREHVLQKPGMYIGNPEPDKYEIWLLNEDGSRMEKRTIDYIAGLFKIFDEIVANATDHYIRLKKAAASGEEVNVVKDIKVNINKETGVISVYNSGDGIDVLIHPEHKVYIPELIFGNMLTSTNYTDDERLGVGTNGVGGKVTNIFSEWFELETVDAERKQVYKQRFEQNMSVTGKPDIKKCAKKPYTLITFKPDYKRFGLDKLSDDMYEVLRKRTYDLCAVTDKDINVFFNDQKLEFKTFEKYVDLYIGSKSEHTRVYECVNDRWEIIASYNQFNGFEQVSFVNGLLTIRGGKHVEYIVNQIVKKVSELISKKSKNTVVKPQAIKDNLILFVKCSIVNPAFDSQSKETLTTPSSKFGSKAEVSDKFIDKLYKSGLAEKVLEISAIHEEKSLKKTDGKKRDVIRGLPKLEDANWAGTVKSKECLLILTEGDSAASSALAGVAEVGRDRYGIFPLKGKVMNVKDAAVSKIADNDEITNIKKILGLETGKKYTKIDDLRYGGIMLLTDSDYDGSHIKGLVMNLFHSMWSTLVKDFKFIHCMQTPIIKVRRRDEVISFYTLTEFENWKQANAGGAGWDIKYYKGLGTSTEEEAKDWFKNMKMVTYTFTDQSDGSIDLAFNKKRADDRKEWLENYDRQVILEYNVPEVSYEDFINKELIHFSNYDVERSIPNMVDGLKISQRKILYSCFKRNLTDKEIKVAQLAAYVAEQSAYHHGEVSLQGAIVNLAQDFVGSNNINLLKPNGMFGSRLHGGKDAAQPRYIFTLLTNVATAIFKKQDNCVLKYLDDDGLTVEPEHYLPVIPMILVNGAMGIGTGFSTSIPCYNPLDICGVLKKMLRGEHVCEEDNDLVPWYRGFTGEIKKINNKYHSFGKFTKISATKIEVTELPLGYWTFDFKSDLETLLDKIPEFRKYENQSSGNKVCFVLHFANQAYVDGLMEVEGNGLSKFENMFKLVSPKGLSTTNMYAFNSKGQIKKFDTSFDIVNEFYDVRLEGYKKRKEHVLGKLEYDAQIMQNKIRFIQEVVAEKVVVHKMKKSELEEYLVGEEYMKHEGGYDYITRIPIYNLTMDKVKEFEDEIVKANEEIAGLKEKKEQEIWLEELEAFEVVYKKFLEMGTSVAKGAAAKKKSGK